MIRRILVGCAVLGAALMFIPMPAASAAPGNVSGPCSGTGDFVKSGHHYTAADSGVDTIPRTDDVKWAGQISGPTGELAYAGHIELQLPPPFGSLSIDSWSGKTDATSNSGTKHYDIPGAVPAHVEFEVKGVHAQGSFSCSGSVKLKIDGSSVNAFSIGSLIGTGLTGAGLAFAGRAKAGA